jgi:hypothetical protein
MLILRPINVFFKHSASAVDIYRAQRKHINYSIWPMGISRHDLRHRYSNSLVIDAGSHFTLRACSQASLSIERVPCITGVRTLVIRPIRKVNPRSQPLTSNGSEGCKQLSYHFPARSPSYQFIRKHSVIP